MIDRSPLVSTSRRALVAAFALAVVAGVGCARSELDICIDHLQNITGESSSTARTRCADLINRNGGKSPF